MVTYELRWFVTRAIDDAELRAFAAHGRLERRRDDYLLGTGDERGIKRRGTAALEDKRREATIELELELELGGRRVSGVIERWRKLRPRGLELDGELDGEWVGVSKRRGLTIVGRCRAELTGLVLESPRWAGLEFQSLALELPLGPDPRAVLTLALNRLLHAQPQLLERFAGAPSLGYPAWLARTLAPM